MAKKKMKKTQKRFRLRFPFWLDLNKPDEAELADAIAILKEKRSFSKTIREGIRLICDLKAGQVTVLFELFPWVKDHIGENTSIEHTTALERQLERLEAMLKEQGGIARPAADYPIGKPTLSGLTKMSLPVFSDLDDGDTLVITKSTGSNTDNFMSSLAKLGI